MVPGYACGCNEGYRLNANYYSCDDIDECAEGTHKCSQNCVNTPGSYHCTCRPGFDLAPDKTSCININECELMAEIVAYKSSRGAIKMSPKAAAVVDDLVLCEFPELCINLEGGYSCACPLGGSTIIDAVTTVITLIALFDDDDDDLIAGHGCHLPCGCCRFRVSSGLDGSLALHRRRRVLSGAARSHNEGHRLRH